jgi:hypothetical protein
MARQTAFVLPRAKPQYIVTNSDKCNLRTLISHGSKGISPKKAVLRNLLLSHPWNWLSSSLQRQILGYLWKIPLWGASAGFSVIK